MIVGCNLLGAVALNLSIEEFLLIINCTAHIWLIGAGFDWGVDSRGLHKPIFAETSEGVAEGVAAGGAEGGDPDGVAKVFGSHDFLALPTAKLNTCWKEVCNQHTPHWVYAWLHYKRILNQLVNSFPLHVSTKSVTDSAQEVKADKERNIKANGHGTQFSKFYNPKYWAHL